MKRLLFTLLLLLAPASVWAQGAGMEPKHLGGNLRYLEQNVVQIQINTATATGVLGRNGTIVTTALSAATTYDLTGASIARFANPAILRYNIIESGDDVAACTLLTIDGVDASGKVIQDNRTDLSETAALTSKVFSRVDRVRFSGCTAALDAGDTFVLVASTRIGLTYPVRAVTDIESVCFSRIRADAEPRCVVNPSSCATVAFSGRLDFDFLDPTSCTWPGTSVAITDEDSVLIRFRASPR